jgi:23S rRNA-/tRNA-specific pseudouridylate synthase
LDSNTTPPADALPNGTNPSVPEFQPEWILFQGGGLLAINKPSGLPVHRGTDHDQGLAECIEAWSRLHPGVVELRVGRPILPLHRLDREATGVVLFGLTRTTARKVQTAFAAHEIAKKYIAVVAGAVEPSGRLQGKVRARLRGTYRWLPAELEYRRLGGDERLNVVEVLTGQGRTHQIRSLFAQAGRPLAGDLRYGKPKPSRQFLEKFGVPSFLLHASELKLGASILGAARTLEAPLPETFRKVADKKGWPASVLGG